MTRAQKHLFATLTLFAALAASAAPAHADTPDLSRSLVRLETNYGDITLELYGDSTPVTVHNFLEYLRRGFYDNLIFHRTIDDFMIQAGAYDPNLYTFLDENPNPDENDWWLDPAFYHEPNDPITNEASSARKNVRGTIAMARQSAADSATSQFFINQVDNSHLDKTTGNAGYAVFGRVLDGMTVVDTIAALPTQEVGDVFEALPVEPVIILRAVEIATFHEDSDDCASTPYLGATPPLTRTLTGLGFYEDESYTDKFTSKTLLNIDCTEWRRSALTDLDVDGFRLTLARDYLGNLYALKYLIDYGSSTHTIFSATSLDEILPLGEILAQTDIYWRLLAGRTNLENLNDPNNTLSFQHNGLTRTQQIIATDVNLDLLPDYPDLVLVRDDLDPNDSALHYSYFHNSVGLVLDVWDASDDPEDPNFFDPTDPSAPVLDRDGFRLAWFGNTPPVFGTYSSDFSSVDYLRAKPGALRVFRGQGDFDGLRYRQSFTSEEHLDVPCLAIEETAVSDVQRPAYRVLIARDSTGVPWLFQTQIADQITFDPQYLEDIRPLEIANDLYLRMIAGNIEEGTTLTSGDETATILATDASLARYPDYEHELVALKAWTSDPPTDVSYSFYHADEGLLLDIWPESDPNSYDPNEPGGLDPNDTGWALAEPEQLTDLHVRIRADRDRFDPQDTFIIRGTSGLRESNWQPGAKLFFNVGAFSIVLETSDPLWQQRGNRPVYLYRSDDNNAKLLILLDLDTGRFRAVGKGYDLTGTTEPVRVEIALGSYYAAADADVAGDLPLTLLSGYQDALACDFFRFAYDNGPNAYYSYDLTLVGQIATQTLPLDLGTMTITLKWGSSKTWTINKTDIEDLGNNRYLYRGGSYVRYFFVDLEKCCFRLRVQNDHLSNLPQDFRVTFADTATRFDESVRIATQ